MVLNEVRQLGCSAAAAAELSARLVPAVSRVGL